MGKWARLVSQGAFPPEVVSRLPRLVWYGRERLLVEQHQGIVTYQENSLRFQTVCGLLNIQGVGLELIQYGPEQAMVKGRIHQVSYPEGEA
ncbi:MAG: hypothetical protein IJ461_07620 [Clostridia bacterium]|nr:hypothetical protein [Clostridia bacterium]